MNTPLRNRLLLPLLAGFSCCGLTPRLPAQTFTTLYSFSPGSCCPGTNFDGMGVKGLVLSGDVLFGWAGEGGSAGGGTVFAISLDGASFTTLQNFTSATATAPPTNDGGARPNGLIVSSNRLYGTAVLGGGAGNGTVFALNTDATAFSTLYSFTGVSCLNCPNGNPDGANPGGGLILSNNTLFGTTLYGATSGNGTLFSLNTDGTGETILYGFTPASPCCPLINSDGAAPQGLTQSNNILYGPTFFGGDSGSGTLFSVNTDGTGLTTLYSFTAIAGWGQPNGDGARPTGALILTGDTLYGTAETGGVSGKGTVFAIKTDGSGFTVLHTFVGSDGQGPQASLMLSGTTLFGTTFGGGTAGNGTVFGVHTDGTGFTTLHTFSATQTNVSGVYTNSDGVGPGGLALSGNALYGATMRGGSGGNGTVFRVALPVTAPQLNITPAGTEVVVSWPSSAGGFTLQSTTNLSSPVWTTNLPTPVVVNGQNNLTNLVSGTQQFYRLIGQ